MSEFNEVENEIPEPISYEEERRHPNADQLMMQEALKTLTAKQRRVWEMHAYDRKTQEEIAEWEGVSQPAIKQRLNVIEKKITLWIKSNMGAYNLLKQEMEAQNDEI